MIFPSKTQFSQNVSGLQQITLENKTTLVMLFTFKAKLGTFAVQYWKIRLFLNFSSISLNYSYFLLQKAWQFFTHFLKKSELWPAGVVDMCKPRTIWHWGVGRYHLKSSQLKQFGHRTNTRFGGLKKTFFPSTGGWWNNHLHMMIYIQYQKIRKESGRYSLTSK